MKSSDPPASDFSPSTKITLEVWTVLREETPPKEDESSMALPRGGEAPVIASEKATRRKACCAWPSSFLFSKFSKAFCCRWNSCTSDSVVLHDPPVDPRLPTWFRGGILSLKCLRMSFLACMPYSAARCAQSYAVCAGGRMTA